MYNTRNLCERIGKLRRQKGMTQEQLAERVGITPQSVSKWENGLSCPDVAVLPILSNVFQVRLTNCSAAISRDFGAGLQRSTYSTGMPRIAAGAADMAKS